MDKLHSLHVGMCMEAPLFQSNNAYPANKNGLAFLFFMRNVIKEIEEEFRKLQKITHIAAFANVIWSAGQVKTNTIYCKIDYNGIVYELYLHQR